MHLNPNLYRVSARESELQVQQVLSHGACLDVHLLLYVKWMSYNVL